jgi:hypothetical protein
MDDRRVNAPPGRKDITLPIRFENEEYARKLRLLVNDYSNPT